MKQVLGDVKRAVLGRPFLIAFSGMVLCLLIGAFSDALGVFRMEEVRVMYGYHRELLLNALSSDIILFAVPILAAIPYTTAFTDDVKSGYGNMFRFHFVDSERVNLPQKTLLLTPAWMQLSTVTDIDALRSEVQP